MKTAYFQKGLSPLGGLLVAAVAGSVLLLILTLLPHYMDYSGIVKAHEKLAEEPTVLTRPLSSARSRLTILLLVHQIRDYDTNNTYIDESGDVPVVGFEYRIEEHLVANVFALLKFKHEVEITQAQ